MAECGEQHFNRQPTQKVDDEGQEHHESQPHSLSIDDHVFNTPMERSPHPEHWGPFVSRNPPYVQVGYVDRPSFC